MLPPLLLLVLIVIYDLSKDELTSIDVGSLSFQLRARYTTQNRIYESKITRLEVCEYHAYHLGFVSLRNSTYIITAAVSDDNVGPPLPTSVWS